MLIRVFSDGAAAVLGLRECCTEPAFELAAEVAAGAALRACEAADELGRRLCCADPARELGTIGVALPPLAVEFGLSRPRIVVVDGVLLPLSVRL